MTEAIRELVWDLRNGFVIDAATGEVVDRVVELDEDLNLMKKHPDGFIKQWKSFSYLSLEDPYLLEVYYTALAAAERLGIDSRELRVELKRLLLGLRARPKYKRPLAAAVLYAAAKHVGALIISPRRIIDEVGASPRAAWLYYSRLFRCCGRKREDLLRAVSVIVAKLGYPKDLFYAARVVEKRLDDYFLSGRSSRVLAAGVVEVAKWLAPACRPLIISELTLIRIAEAAGVTEVAARYTRNNILRHLGIDLVYNDPWNPQPTDTIYVPKEIYEELKPILEGFYAQFIKVKEAERHG